MTAPSVTEQVGSPRPGGAAPDGQPREEAPVTDGTLSPATQRRFDREIAKYPPEGKASAVMACLAILQQERGWVSEESERLVAEALGMPVIAVHEVTTFYNMYNQAPVGRTKLNVCTNLPCQLRGGQHALEHLCSRLGVEEGGTTADGAFTVQKSECLGACADAPVALVNDRQMVSFLSDERLDALVEELRVSRRAAPETNAEARSAKALP